MSVNAYNITKQGSGKRLANWVAIPFGLSWLNKLVEEKRVVCEQSGYFPSIYTAQAKYILPILQEGPPSVRPGLKWERQGNERVNPKTVYDIEISEGEVSACNPEEMLCITVWELD